MELKEDYRTLGLDPTSDLEEVTRAYERMKALYSEGSLATYSLLTEDERQEMLIRVERAYLHISRNLSRRQEPPPSRRKQKQPPRTAAKDSIPGPVTREESIGGFLKRRREDLGLTLKELAGRTKIRSTYLESVEREDYAKLPAPVYLRGFVIEFAKALQIDDPEVLASRYIENMQKDVEK